MKRFATAVALTFTLLLLFAAARPVDTHAVTETKSVIQGWLNTGYNSYLGMSPGSVHDSLVEQGIPQNVARKAMLDMEREGKVDWTENARKTASVLRTPEMGSEELARLLIRAGYTPEQAQEASITPYG